MPINSDGYAEVGVIPPFKKFRVKSRYKAAFGGRGSGKSRFFADAAIFNALNVSGLRVLCVREVQKSLKESAKRLIEDEIRAQGVEHLFNIKTTEIDTPGGGTIAFAGMQDHTADSIKSYEGFDVAWVEEAQTLSARSLELLRPTIRKAGSELWFSWNPRSASDPVDAFFRGEKPPQNAVITKVNYNDNPFFPKELEEERLLDYEANPQRYGHIWLGEYEPAVVGAIWDRATIHSGRLSDAPVLNRIVVAVDPAVTSPETGQDPDEHGIIVCGLGEDQRGYVLDDVSRRGSPHQWATAAIAAYDQHEADAIVIEINQGGDMVRHTLESIRPGIRIIEVRATRGKHVRAEPISALYSLGRMSHVGSYPELEAQMCQMTAAGFEGEGSPDRVDALVWGFTELFPKMVKKSKKRSAVEHRPTAGGWMG